MKSVQTAVVFSLAGLIFAAPKIAFAAPPPPPPPGDAAAPPPGADLPPPPPPGDRPPPHGAAVIIDHGPDRRVHIDVRCAENETARACADIATQLFDKARAATPAQ